MKNGHFGVFLQGWVKNVKPEEKMKWVHVCRASPGLSNALFRIEISWIEQKLEAFKVAPLLEPPALVCTVLGPGYGRWVGFFFIDFECDPWGCATLGLDVAKCVNKVRGGRLSCLLVPALKARHSKICWNGSVWPVIMINRTKHCMGALWLAGEVRNRRCCHCVLKMWKNESWIELT